LLLIGSDKEFRESLFYPEARSNPQHILFNKYRKQHPLALEDVWDGLLAKDLIKRHNISSK
jgi:hypothetical protein